MPARSGAAARVTLVYPQASWWLPATRSGCSRLATGLQNRAFPSHPFSPLPLWRSPPAGDQPLLAMRPSEPV